MSRATWHTGDSLTVLRTLPDHSVDLVMTSPPFLALRSYLPADHPDKAKEIGSEATPGAFLDVLLDVVVELRRVLAPHGSLVVELGDTYSGSGGAGGDYNEGGLRESAPGFDGSAKRTRKNNLYTSGYSGGRHGNDAKMIPGDLPVTGGRGWPLAKSLCMIPSSFAFALAYGRNPWTGRELEPWRVRNLIAWCRPNPPVGALGDKFRPGTSYLTVACVGASRYFDLDAVRTEAIDQRFRTTNGPKGEGADPAEVQTANYTTRIPSNPAGAPPLDWWEIPTHPYPGSHYATFPPQLVVRPVKAMCPQRVCRVCGKPTERITENLNAGTGRNAWNGRVGEAGFGDRPNVHESVTLGWSDCGHDDWRAGVVLDPFAGSGTTLEVATGHGRDAIGIDLDPRNAELARERVGMFLEMAA